MGKVLGKAIAEGRKKRSLTQDDLGKAVGVSRAAVSQWEAGETEPASGNMQKIADKLGVELGDMLKGRLVFKPAASTQGVAAGNEAIVRRLARVGMGHGAEAAVANIMQDVERVPVEPGYVADSPVSVPIYGVAAGGTDNEFYMNGEVVDYAKRPDGIRNAKGVFALYVVNTSMEPRWYPGDLIYVNPQRPPSIGDFVVVELVPEQGDRNGKAMVKRLAKRTASLLILEQYNPAGTIEVETGVIKAVHRVIPANELLGN